MRLIDRLNEIIIQRMGPANKLDDADTTFARALCDAIEAHVEERIAAPRAIDVQIGEEDKA